MFKKLIFILLLAAVQIQGCSFEQTFTKYEAYLDDKAQICEKEKASYFCESQKDAEGQLQGTYIVYTLTPKLEKGALVSKWHYVNSKMTGIYTLYHTNGQKLAEGNYADDTPTGVWKAWYENGVPFVDYRMELLKPELTVEMKVINHWDSTGTQQVKDGTGAYYSKPFTNNPYILQNSYTEAGKYENYKKQGVWKGWRSGKPYYEETWEAGKLKKGTSYDEDGNCYTYNQVEEYPEFVGGDKGLATFLKDNFKYPKKALRKEIEGKVFVGFVVTATGSVDKIHTLKSVHPLLDEEAMRLVRLIPRCKAGKVRGQAVNVSFQQPINFKIE